MPKSKLFSKYPNLIHSFGDKYSKLNLNSVITTEQIHGDKVIIINNGSKKFIKDSDGLVTGQRLTLGVLTADCLPIFFYDPENKFIAAIHAGWKGLLLGIINNAIVSMKKLGSKPKDLLVSVGPHIHVCCYKVNFDRIKKFSMTDRSDRLHLSSSHFIKKETESFYLNLSNIVLNQLTSLGIPKSNIEISDICTSCDKNYWSFRRDKKKSGRMLNIIGLL